MQDGEDSNEIGEVVKFLDEFREVIFSLINRKSFNKSTTEFLPPWIMTVHPLDVPGVHDLEVTSPLFGLIYWYWRGGDGGTYRGHFLAQYWNTLSLDEKKIYFSKYDLGPDWPERKEWFRDFFGPNQIDSPEGEFDSIRSELLGDGF